MPNSAPRLDTLFSEAVEILDPLARSAYLERACAADPELRQRVEHLVAAHFRAGDFLERPTDDLAVTSAYTPTTEVPDRDTEEVGGMIGPYKLLERIGEGGMGAVYVAEQTAPVKRRVALKVIKPGMDSREVVARFEAERQALALMDHPHIARVFDGGSTAAGRPFFVMELVRGLSITDYCDQVKLPAVRRLRLFAQVCRAVQHAHQKGVIHRDLKPSNVLVTLHDGEPVPKVIDFGIAKAVNQSLTDKTVYTRLAQLVGTPLYMSPEQAELSGLDIDTRSDVYSLGVLLYELLTGTTPFDATTFQKAGFDEIRRMIREDEPPRPSQRVSTLDAAARSTVSARRGVDGRQLGQQLRGDLDWVVMKALEKDRTRRYESAGAFATDVERHLAHEPVVARPPTTGYRLRKFARRNRAGLVVSAVLAVAALAVVGALGWGVRDRFARRATAEQTALAALADADNWEEHGRWPDALAALDRAAAVLGDGSDGLRADVQRRRRDVQLIRRLDEIQLETATVKDGNFDFALGDRLYSQAFQEYGADPDALAADDFAGRLPTGAVRPEVVAALEDWARIRGETPGKNAVGRLLAAADAADPDPWRQQVRRAWAKYDSKALVDLARSADLARLHPCGVMLLQHRLPTSEAIPVLREAAARRPGEFWIAHTLAFRLSKAKKAGDTAEAVGYYRAALALRPDSPGVWLNYGYALSDLKRYDEAIAAYERALAIQPGYASAYLNLGGCLFRKRELDRAEATIRHYIRLEPNDSSGHYNLGVIRFNKGAFEEAMEEYREATRLKPSDGGAHLYYGIALGRLNRHDEAFEAYQKALKLAPDNPEVHNSIGSYLCDRKKDYAAAITSLRRAIELRPDYAVAHANLGNALGSKGLNAEAVAAYEESLRLQPDHATAYSGLGKVLMKLGKKDEAIAAFERACQLLPDDPEGHYNRGIAFRLRGKLNESIRAYQEAVRLNPKHGAAQSDLGNVYAMVDRLDDAIAAHRKAVRADPTNAQYHYNLASTFLENDQFDKAIASFQDALRIGPATAEMYCNLGAALQGAKRYREALEQFRHGHEIGSKQPGWKYPSARWVKDCEALLAKEEAKNAKRETLPPPRAAK